MTRTRGYEPYEADDSKKTKEDWLEIINGMENLGNTDEAEELAEYVNKCYFPNDPVKRTPRKPKPQTWRDKPPLL